MKKYIFLAFFLTFFIFSCSKNIIYENAEKKSTIYISYNKNEIIKLEEKYTIEIYNNLDNKEDIIKSLNFFITSLNIDSKIKQEKDFTVINLKEIYDIDNNKHYLSPTLKSFNNTKDFKKITNILINDGYKIKE